MSESWKSVRLESYRNHHDRVPVRMILLKKQTQQSSGTRTEALRALLVKQQAEQEGSRRGGERTRDSLSEARL